MAKVYPSASDNQKRITAGVSAPNRNTNTNTPVKHLPAVAFGDIHAVTNKIVQAVSAQTPKPVSVRVGRRQPGQVSASSMPPVRGVTKAPVVGPDVKAAK